MIELKYATIDSAQIAYSSETEFWVQLGKGKSAYKTKWAFKGDLGQAILYYKGLNVANGYKKRLLMPSSSKGGILAKYIS